MVTVYHLQVAEAKLQNAATVALHFLEGINMYGEILLRHFRYAGQELL